MNGARRTFLVLLLAAAFGRAAADNGADTAPRCNGAGAEVQVLGGLTTGATPPSGQLVWIDGKARVLLDTGPGAAQRLQASGAHAADLDVILLTRLHTGRTLDFPALVEAALREARERPLPVYGPVGNRLNPSTVTFVRALLDGTRGAYRYLGSVLRPLTQDGFKLQPHDVRARPARVAAPRKASDLVSVYANERVTVTAAYVADGNLPALAWRITAQERSFVFVGAAGRNGALERLAQRADVLVADHAIPEGASTAERARHLPPSAIGDLAAAAQAKRLVLVVRAPHVRRDEAATLAAIRARYAGPVVFADDYACFAAP